MKGFKRFIVTYLAYLYVMIFFWVLNLRIISLLLCIIFIIFVVFDRKMYQ